MISVHDRVIIKAFMDSKSQFQFQDGTKITLERDWNNLNRREVNPVNGFVLSENQLGIAVGLEVLMNHNSLHPVNELNDYLPDGENADPNVKYYAIPNPEIYAFHDGKEWQPAPNYLFGLRVFRPHTGLILAEPKQIIDTLFVTKGELKGKVVLTLKFCDYEMVFQDKDNREGRIIRFRHFPHDENNSRQEVIAIDHEKTKQVKKGELLVGLTPTTAKIYAK